MLGGQNPCRASCFGPQTVELNHLFQIDRLSSTVCGPKQLARQGFCPQAYATTFALSSKSILLLWVRATENSGSKLTRPICRTLWTYLTTMLYTVNLPDHFVVLCELTQPLCCTQWTKLTTLLYSVNLPDHFVVLGELTRPLCCTLWTYPTTLLYSVGKFVRHLSHQPYRTFLS